MKYFKKLEYWNIYLSPVNTEDYELFTKWINDNRISDWINHTKSVYWIEAEKSYFEEVAKNLDPSIKCFEIIRKEDDKVLWICDLQKIDYIDWTATIWIFIWEVDEHNKWYWTDSLKALLWFWFNTLNLRDIELHVFSFNEPAIKCYTKVWFKEYWRRINSHYCNWKYYDEILMNITKEQFNK